MRPTIKEIARIAGVTHATVSMVLNNKKGISQEVSEKIRKIADDIGYVPNLSARNLVNKKTDTLGIFLLNFPKKREDRIFYYYSELFQEFLFQARKKGFTVLFFTEEDSTRTDVSYATFCLEHNVRTAIFFGISPYDNNLNEIKKLKHTQVILFDIENTINCNNIISNSFSGIYEMMEYFRKNNKRKIAVLKGSDDAEISTHKKILELDILSSEMDMEITYFEGDFLRESGHTFGKKVDISKFHGIFAMNDAMAIGILEGLKERGLENKIEIVGFDNMAVTGVIAPNLSSIAHDNNKIIKSIFKIIKEDSKIQQFVIPTTFVQKNWKK